MIHHPCDGDDPDEATAIIPTADPGDCCDEWWNMARSRGPIVIPRLLTEVGRTRKSPCRHYLDARFGALVMISYNFLPIHKYPDFYLSILACLNIVYFGSDAAAELVYKVRFAAVQYKSSKRGW